MKPIILFDLDGTLTDPKEGITKAIHYALQHFGIIEDDFHKLEQYIGPPLRETFMKGYGFSKEQAEEAVQAYREYFAPIGIFENKAYDGVVELLAMLKQKQVLVGIATSKPTVFAKKIADKFNFTPYLDVVIGSELDGSRGKKKEVIEACLTHFNVTDEEKGQVYMVGDRNYDIIGAKECQIKSIGVEFGYAKEGELTEAGADYVVASVQELSELLSKLCE